MHIFGNPTSMSSYGCFLKNLQLKCKKIPSLARFIYDFYACDSGFISRCGGVEGD